ncbi:MAG: SDR family oxidoreductase [Patescibacteria group bacterium]|nr:SDR family oxidoreductase [Patescibacteria group bacterium]
MQTVLVAGGAGFIGSHLCKKLLSENYKVICVDNLITGNKNNLNDILSNENFTFLEKDVTKNFQEDSKLDFIFHLASPASPNKKSPRSYINHPLETLLVNSLGTYNLLELAKETSAKFLYASSSEIYGDPKISPQKEDYFGNVNPNGVRSVYDEGKRFGEAITASYVRESGLDARIIRIFNTYGPFMQADDGRVVSNFINQAISNKPLTIYGDGSQTRSFCYVDDMVEGLMFSMFSDKTKGEVINLGNLDERKISEIATMIKDIVKSSSKIIFEELPEDDPETRRPDISKAKKLIGWSPKVNIVEGLKKTVEYFKNI